MERRINWKYEIGQIIKDDKKDLIIIDRRYKLVTRYNKQSGNNYISTQKWYKYHCNKCGYNGGKYYDIANKRFRDEFWMIENSVEKQGCPCCSEPHKIIVKGITDIATTNPSIIKYLVNPSDALVNTYKSKTKVLCKCPNCGYEKEMIIGNLTNRGFSCLQCSDKISYGEKFMFNLLKIFLDNNFKCQYNKKDSQWCKMYKYDFYFELNNQKYIIETHGRQHYNGGFKTYGGRTLEEEQENDKIKKELAIQNGIKEKNYITIDRVQ